jgi:hypothetical protein
MVSLESAHRRAHFGSFSPGLRVYKFKEQPRNCNRKKRCRCRAEDEEGFLYFWYILRGFTNHSHRTSTSLTMNRSTPWISLLCLSGVLSRNGIVLQASPPPPSTAFYWRLYIKLFLFSRRFERPPNVSIYKWTDFFLLSTRCRGCLPVCIRLAPLHWGMDFVSTRRTFAMLGSICGSEAQSFSRS